MFIWDFVANPVMDALVDWFYSQVVGFLGAFLEQMLHFGFTPTTLLWILPPAIRGLCIGLGAIAFRKQMSLEHLTAVRRPWVYYAVNIVTAVIVSLGNTAVYYLDSIIYHYYSYALIFGVLGARIVNGILTTLLTATVALPVLAALSRTRLVRART